MPEITLITTNDVKLVFIIWPIALLFIFISYLIDKSRKSLDNLEIIFGFLSIFVSVAALALTIRLIFLILNNSLQEQTYFDSILMYGKNLQKVINTSPSEAIYTQALEFNSKLTTYKNIISNKLYAPMHWTLDWSTIPFITFN